MIDTIKPIGLDLTKNLHGHVRVELRDRWTGRVVDSQEKDNLVTNAVQKVLMQTAWLISNNETAIARLVAPLATRALGGLLVFGGTLTENANNTTFPTNVPLVAMCNTDADSSNPKAGSYNSVESVSLANGFTTVWDFETSQANGTIASLARTSHLLKTNFNTIFNPNFSVIQGSAANSLYPTTIYYIGYDEETHSLYFGVTGAGTYDGVSVNQQRIYKVSIDFNAIGITSALLPRASQWEVIKTLSSSDGQATAGQWRYDPYSKEFIYFQLPQTLHVLALDGTHSTRTLSPTTLSANIAATENYYWRYYNNLAYRTSKTNLADTQTFTVGSAGAICAGDNDLAIYYPNSTTIPAYAVYPDGTLLNVGVGISQYDLSPCGPFVKYPGGGGLTFNPRYLGTIANLDSPVTKSSSQTMKVTYTLTEA